MLGSQQEDQERYDLPLNLKSMSHNEDSVGRFTALLIKIR